ncbi:sugar phosphate nucleotidyltransferase [Brachyspira pulli]|uniref:sugar phosphate nucleotidyltransferase n=1 Tax=Brachyspira pulli TaxID=310721 RepID=UPI00300647ED
MKAIILAAGRGTRLAPMTLIKPKPLLKINGKTLLENMIKILKNNGVDDIIVVTGYKHEMFDEYQERLGFKKVVYDDYAVKNSSASLKLVIDEIVKGTIIFNGDLYLRNNFFDYIRSDLSQFLAQKITDGVVSWGYIVDRNFRLIDIDTNATSGYGDGIAIFDNENDIAVLKEELMKTSDDEYWEYCILRSLNKINFYAFNYDDLYVEIDSFKDALYYDLLTPKEIAEQCSDDGNIEKLAGITNVNYKIRFLGHDKVIRIPGKGTENIIDRNAESRILSLIYDKDIVPKSDFYESDIKLTDFLYGYRSLDFEDLKNYDTIFPLIVKQMKKLHSINHNDHKDFNVISMVKEIENYERLVNINIVTKIEHKFLLNLAYNMDKGNQVLCHRDLQLPNIMYNGSDIKFVDFEYAGFSSILWEIGNFTAELELTYEQICSFIEIYEDITYEEVIIGQLMSNYIWALWGWIYDSIDLGRNYLSRFHSNINYLMKNKK